MGKKCDLCDGVARMYCESDQASLCWNCDAKVHGANFLVAKHTRCLLCTACQSPTPWKATGLRFGPTFSVCDSCVALKSGEARVSTERSQEVNENRVRLRDDDDDGDSAESYDDDEDEDEDEEYSDEDDVDEEEGENQVVPWSAAAAAQLPPVMSASSSNGGDLAAKRTRDYSDEEMGCSSAQESIFSRPLKRRSIDERAFKSTAAINSLVGLEGGATLNGAVSSPSSSSSPLMFAISKKWRDLSR